MKRFYLSKLIILIAALSGLSWSAFAQSTTFLYTGGVQTYTVPLGATSISVVAIGGAGGSPYTTGGVSVSPSLGGMVQATMNVTPLSVYYVVVGGAGTNDAGFAYCPGGFNGGGEGYYFGAGSGGATDLRNSANPVTSISGTSALPYTATNRVLVAGGGGAGGDYCAAGGLGGGTTGGAGAASSCVLIGDGPGGSGGTQSGPGPTGANLGALGIGGSNYTGGVYGPGGGGYWGGNSGLSLAGGGGGSNYPATADGTIITAVVHTQGYSGANGNGQMIITVLCNGAGTITGTASACAGSTTTLVATGASGGTWSSGNTAVASVASNGVVAGISPGTAVITYNVPNPCGGVVPATVTVTINQTPTPITGTTSVCDFVTTNLSSTPTTGAWTSSNNGLATVSGGVVTGVNAGVPIITYTLPDGCITTTPVTVNSGPAPITGTAVVCAGGATVSLGEASTGGTWSSSLGGVAAISPAGVLTGVVQGNTTIAYTFVSTGCVSTVVATVNGLPSVFPLVATAPPGFSNSAYCAGSASTISIELLSSTSGVSYQLFDATTAGTTPFPPVISTGGVLNFGIESNIGTYTAVGTTPLGCSANMGGSASISITALPPVLPVTASNGGLYCASSSGVSVTVTGITLPLDTYRLYSGSTLAGTAIGTLGSLTFPGLYPAGSYTVIASDATTNHCSSTMNSGIPVTITVEPIPGAQTITVENGGYYCAGTAGVHVGLAFSNSGVEYSLYDGGAFVDSQAGSNSGLDFGLQTAPGIYTVSAVNSTSRCTSNMPGSITITINNPPTPFALTGGGNYCPGSAGVPIGVSGSDVGATYQLYNGTAAVGGPVTGTGAGFNFGVFNTSGTYTVVATSTAGCMGTLPGSLTVAPNTAPNAYIVTGGGPFCAGSAGPDIILGGGDYGVSYQLYIGTTPVGLPVPGAGANINFGSFTTAGTYTVVANNGSCTANMTGSAVIVVNPLPNAHNVTGSGGYCANLAGLHVGLDFSDVGVSYQLFGTGGPIGSAIPGSGSGLNFGIEPSGDYTVVATNTATGCTLDMTGSALVVENPLPGPYNVTGTGDYCAGGIGLDLGLDGSDGSVNYQLYFGTTPVGSPVAGSGEGGFNFGYYTPAGTYTVIGTTSQGCTSTMTGDAVITIDPLPAVYTISAPGGANYCSGGAGSDLVLSGSAVGINYQLFNSGSGGAILPGDGTALDFGLQPAGDYTIVANNPATTCSSNMAGVEIVNILPLPNAHNVTGGGNYCIGGTGSPIGLNGSDPGIQYQLLVGGSPIGSIQPGTGAAINFGLRTPVGSYTVLATNAVTTCTVDMEGSVSVNTIPLPGAYPVTGGGAYCAGSSAPSIGLTTSGDEGVTYMLYLGSTRIDTVTGGSSIINFGAQSAAGTYTVVGVGTTNRCSQNMSGDAIVTVNTVNAYAVIGGGAFCAGGTGVHIGQSSSSPGISYQLVNGVNIGSPVIGTGGPIDFGPNTLAGTYTVVGTNPATECSGNMTGSATIVINPLPPVHTVTGGPTTVCAGSSTGITVGLNGSNEAINYQLYFGTTPIGGVVFGTGASLSLGTGLDSGAYTAVAINPTTGCMSNMSGSASLTVKPLPVAYPVTAENYGNYCAGDTGVHIGLLNSTPGVSYLMHGGSLTAPINVTLPGTGSALDFGLETVAGTYIVTGTQTDVTPACESTMSGGAYVYIIPLPIVHNVTGTGGYCPGGAGVDVGLDGSQAGIYYQLYDAGVAVGSPIYGSGVALNFGIQPAGNYTIVGSSEVIAMGYVTTCPNPMFGTAVVSVDSLLTPSITLRAYPGSGVGVWHIDSMKVFVTNGGTNPTFQWYVNGNIISGATSATFSNYSFFNGDSVSCIVQASGPCGGLNTTQSIVLSLHNVGVNQVTAAGSDVKLVPNPNNGTFTVKGTLGLTADEEVTMEVTNMLGQVVYTDKVMTQGGNINARIELGNSLANGMYIMTLRSGTQNNVIHFVIEQ